MPMAHAGEGRPWTGQAFRETSQQIANADTVAVASSSSWATPSSSGAARESAVTPFVY